MCCNSAFCQCKNHVSRSFSLYPNMNAYVCPYSRSVSGFRNTQIYQNVVLPYSPQLVLNACTCVQDLPQLLATAPKYEIYTDDKRGDLSRASWGETSGLYPTDSGKASLLYKPENWDQKKLEELMRCRAAVQLVSTRGERFHSSSPNTSDKIQRLLATYHLKANFPTVDREVKEEEGIKFFYLSPNENAVHTGIDGKYWDQRIVKKYGPFYNVGGGDVPKGLTYVLFYQVSKKKPK